MLFCLVAFEQGGVPGVLWELVRLVLGSCLILGYFSLARVVTHAFPACILLARCEANPCGGECQRDRPVRVLGCQDRLPPGVQPEW